MVCKRKLKFLCVYWVHQRVFSLQFETLLQTFIVKLSKETYDRFQHFDQLAFAITKLQFHVPFLIGICSVKMTSFIQLSIVEDDFPWDTSTI